MRGVVQLKPAPQKRKTSFGGQEKRALPLARPPPNGLRASALGPAQRTGCALAPRSRRGGRGESSGTKPKRRSDTGCASARQSKSWRRRRSWPRRTPSSWPFPGSRRTSRARSPPAPRRSAGDDPRHGRTSTDERIERALRIGGRPFLDWARWLHALLRSRLDRRVRLRRDEAGTAWRATCRRPTTARHRSRMPTD